MTQQEQYALGDDAQPLCGNSAGQCTRRCVWLATIKSHSAVLPVAVFLHAVRTEDTLELPPARREIGRVGDAPGIICCREIRF
jgi:hypothetical protein